MRPTDEIRDFAEHMPRRKVVDFGHYCDHLDAKYAALVEACEALADEVEWKMDPDKEAYNTQKFNSVGDVLEFARAALRAAKGDT